MSETEHQDRTPIVLTLLFILVLLLLILFYLYKRLNRDTNDQYTIQRLVFREGGLRDRVMQGIGVVESRLRLLFRRDEQENIGNIEEGNNNVEEDKDQEDVLEELNESVNKKEEQKDQHEEDSSDDYSSIDLKERLRQNIKEEEEEKKDEPGKEEGSETEDGSKERDANNEERVGLLVDIKTFSGSAIWSEEKMEESDVTAL
ncbi:cilia- and flagella-associated protein 251 [Trichomycterus rosablanca]|uniref:cilia- and flagella-associated protein 251 n=1 Tax=Trichomycterus rosablanca TaxID=2290929 RepID=UPI002F34F963